MLQTKQIENTFVYLALHKAGMIILPVEHRRIHNYILPPFFQFHDDTIFLFFTSIRHNFAKKMILLNDLNKDGAK